jgi:transcriptional regulator with XRE-family HTH domain
MQLRNRAVMREFILLKGLSEREVARRAGLSHSTLNHLLTGRRVACSVRTAASIERVLGVADGVFFRAL